LFRSQTCRLEPMRNSLGVPQGGTLLFSAHHGGIRYGSTKICGNLQILAQFGLTSQALFRVSVVGHMRTRNNRRPTLRLDVKSGGFVAGIALVWDGSRRLTGFATI